MANAINNILRQNSSLTSEKKSSTVGSVPAEAEQNNEKTQPVGQQDAAQAAESAAQKEELKQIAMQDINGAVEKLSNHVQNIKRELNFSVDDATGDVVIKVIDAETDQLIRSIPSEEVVERAQFLNSSVGNLLKTKV